MVYNFMFYIKLLLLCLIGYEVIWFDDDFSFMFSFRCVYKVLFDCIMLEEDEDIFLFFGVVDVFFLFIFVCSFSENR